ncbi:hypothetical protein EGW08_005241 [Elysia chlorotica]|uniref:Uncharacterized protein n=1 Tax=Elysia chlorotica TaxID=188477 RepID=A0A3S1BRL1_ELYCH|nr:hypothetical protein EGW08_005241 [Elysia chlorotica]
MPVVMSRVAVMGLTLVVLPASAALVFHWYRHWCRAVADRKRADQGNHECEVFALGYPEAMEGTRRWESCTKNRGHPTFTPIKEFSMQHLPPDYRLPEVFDLIQNISARTVRRSDTGRADVATVTGTTQHTTSGGWSECTRRATWSTTQARRWRRTLTCSTTARNPVDQAAR